MAQYDDMNGMKATFRTLGCKLNYAETSYIEDKLRSIGVETTDNGNADICLVNTCSVTEMADHKCRQVIHKLVKDNPQAFVVVMGCYVQLQPQKVSEIKRRGPRGGHGKQRKDIGIYRRRHCPQTPTEKRSTAHAEKRSNARHQDFCSLVFARRQDKIFSESAGRLRLFLYILHHSLCTRAQSQSFGGFHSNAGKKVAAQGGKEIVITGVNIGDFGRKGGENFEMLVKRLDKVDGIERYRISSIEPNLLTKEIIDFCAKSRSFMPHFHIPLQSGSDTVLKLMHRRYDTKFFAEKISEVHAAMPDAFIGIDVIVGTRGETPELFEETFEFLSALDFAQLHVFPYLSVPAHKL